MIGFDRTSVTMMAASATSARMTPMLTRIDLIVARKSARPASQDPFFAEFLGVCHSRLPRNNR